MDEVLQERMDLIEHQLARAVKDVNGRAYNRTAHLPARRDMMQRWADYLDKLRVGADVIPMAIAKKRHSRIFRVKFPVACTTPLGKGILQISELHPCQ
jgi:hypothetical protein